MDLTKTNVLTEKWFVKQCKYFINLFERVLDFTCLLLVKILRMLFICLTAFEDAKIVDRQFWKFDVGVQDLAWDFKIGPMPQQVHGLYARVRLLPSHYMQTFEEMIQYGFIKGWQSSFFSALATPTQRFLAHQVQVVQMLCRCR